ncbi:hypothetical protein [Natronomonas halophila]|nr:hypothetical protein [Natronomonas halophila]
MSRADYQRQLDALRADVVEMSDHAVDGCARIVYMTDHDAGSLY